MNAEGKVQNAKCRMQNAKGKRGVRSPPFHFSFCLPASSRRGVTLMEVMISIFVLSVGMLGVAALIPVGRYALVETGKADRSGACGRAALRTIKANRILERTDTSWYRWQILGRTAAYDSYCIDPLGIARAPSSSQVDRFPAKQMNSGDTSYQYSMPRATLYLPGTSQTMPLATAERIFTWTDDRDFSMPEDRRQRPRPKVLFDNNLVAPFPRLATEPATGNPVTLETEGKYTWMVTLSPYYSVPQAGYSLPPDQVPYNATVVVFFGRNFGPPDTSQETPSERVVRVTNANSLGLGLGGGRIQLYAQRRGWLEIESNQYIMLAGRPPGQPSMSAYVWYRVVAMGEITNPTPGNYYRYVTLEGPDWPIPPGQNMNQYTTYAVLVTGAIGAYTMPLERESNPLWVR